MKYNIFGSALVFAITVLPGFVQGAPTELNSNTTTAIAAGGVSQGKNIAARDIQWSKGPTSGGPYAFKFYGQGGGPSPTTTIFIVENGDTRHTICVWPEYTQYGVTQPIPDPEIPGSELVCLNPGQSLHFGNIPGQGGNGFTGAVRGFIGCDGHGKNCPGDLGTVSKIEWTFEPQGKKGVVAINQSLVDGYNLATKITYGPGNNCAPMDCSIPQGKLQQICPAESLMRGPSGIVGCKSQCRTDGTDEHCCKGNFDGWRCPQSSKYFIDACPAAMAFPFDHEQYRATFPQGRVQYCDAKGEVKVTFSVTD